MIKRLGGASMLLLLLANPADLSSCGPFFTEPIFTNTTRPDGSGFGILQPTYERRYLAIAYRVLSGKPLNDAQSDSVAHLRTYRVGEYVQTAMETWLKARRQVPGTEEVQIELYRQTPEYNSVPSCLSGAFASARQTLGDYIRDFGPDSPQTHDWLAAQDQVFANCGSGTAVPTPLNLGDSPRLRADRAYQIASAYFYAAFYDKAKAAFEQIAADKESPWQLLASYLVARVYLRQNNFAAAEKQLQAVLTNPAESPVHRAVQSLLDYTQAKLDPPAQLLALSKRLMQSDSTTLGKDLSDYTFLYDRLENSPALKAVTAKDELTDWIFTFQTGTSASEESLLRRWQTANSVPWLIAALHYATGKDPTAKTLIDPANNIAESSPAYPPARFEGVRLLIEAGDAEQAAKAVDEALHSKALEREPSVANAFHAERMKIARSFATFLANAPRVGQGDDGNQHAINFDADATTVFNTGLPQSLWLEAIHSEKLDKQLRTRLAQAGWTRAVILGANENVFASEISKLKSSYASELKPALTKFDAVFWALHHPELQPWVRSGSQRATSDGKIDDFRDNWWCTSNAAGRHGYSFDYSDMQASLTGILPRLYPPGSRPTANFLTAAQQRTAEQEHEKLESAGGGPTFLPSAVLSWAKSHPRDPRNPEALALAVKTSRFGCTDTQSANFVREAFNLLHSRYGKNEWARRTQYWYR